MRLHHLHLPRPIPYVHSLRLQEALIERHFADKTALRKDASLTSVAPPPTLLTFQTNPTYTVGRRHLNANPLSASQISFLTSNEEAQNDTGLATFYPSPRGGLLTYHAPGQLTAYLVCNLRTHNLTPRCYIRLLENTVMRTCARHGVPNVMTTEDPGVWIAERSGSSVQKTTDEPNCPAGTMIAPSALTSTRRKVCAIGVQVSRGVTSHGIGLNVLDAPIQEDETVKELYTLPKGNSYVTDLETEHTQAPSTTELKDSTIPAPGYLSWGFSRIVACGLEGRSVTWLSREQQHTQKKQEVQATQPAPPTKYLTLENVADSLAIEVARSLQIKEEDIDQITEEDILDVQRPSWEVLRTSSDKTGSRAPEMDLGNQYRFRDLRQDTGMRILGFEDTRRSFS